MIYDLPPDFNKSEIVSAETIKSDVSPAEAKKTIAARAQSAVLALKAKNMSRLAALVHPVKGVRFTPYGYIDAESDLVFKPTELKSLMTSRKRHDWGAEDGTGDQLKMTFANYYKRFVYDKDFAAAPKVSYNERQASGNTMFNGNEVYPNSIFVEYYFRGTNKAEFMDWRALYLTFEKYKGTWFLVSVSHNQWTI